MNNPTAPINAAMDEPVEISRWFLEEVQPHEPLLRAWLRNRFPGRNDIDDLVQEAYVRMFRARSIGQVRNPRNYLFTTARNIALDLFRHEKLIAFESIGESVACNVLSVDRSVSDTVGQKQEIEILRAAMQALPTRCRHVFTLRKIHGLSHLEIAAQLGISVRTVEAQIDTAMRRCAAYLHERGLP